MSKGAGGQVSYVLPVGDSVLYLQALFGNARSMPNSFSGGQCSMFCISAELKMYQGIKVEWIGSFAQPDIGNLPPCLPGPIGLLTGQDLPNLPPCLHRFRTEGMFGHLSLRLSYPRGGTGLHLHRPFHIRQVQPIL